MTEEEALAIGFANLKGTRTKDLLVTAEALKTLKGLPRYGSNAKVGQALGVSGEIVREFLTLLDLPVQVQQMFQDRRLSLEQGRRLWQLQRTRPDLVPQVADAMTGISVKDGRNLVDYILRHPELSVKEATRRVLDSKTVIEPEYHVIAILSEVQYRRLATAARRQKIAVDGLVTSIVEQWLDSGKSDG